MSAKNTIIKNPEHYFKRYIALENLHDQVENSKFYKQFISLEALMDSETGLSHKNQLYISVNSEDILFERYACDKSLLGWLDYINDIKLHSALMKLPNKQLKVISLRFHFQLTQAETAQFLGVTQQAVQQLEKKQ